DEATKAYELSASLVPQNGIVTVIFLLHLLHNAKDIERAKQLVEESQSRHSLGMRRWMHALIANAQGDKEPLRQVVEAWVANRPTVFVAASLIEKGYYRLGDYSAHIHWFATRVLERDELQFVPLDLRERPNYWDALTDWALSEPTEVRSRMALVNEHRA